LSDLAFGEKTMPEQLTFALHRDSHRASELVLVVSRSLPCQEVPRGSGHQPEEQAREPGAGEAGGGGGLGLGGTGGLGDGGDGGDGTGGGLAAGGGMGEGGGGNSRIDAGGLGGTPGKRGGE